MEIIGTKYQTYINDELVILRLFKINRNKNSNRYEYILLDDNNNKVKINSKEELNKFVILAPDAVMNIMETDSNNHKDIFVCCQKTDKLSQTTPDLILRQDVYSYTKNWSPENNTIFVGDCLTVNTAPSYKDFTDLMEFDEIINSDSVVLYIDDTINDIKLLLDQQRFKKYDNALLKIWKEYHMNAVGYCKTLIELIEDNNFMANYKSLFNIAQLDFPIKLDDNFTDDGVITLNNKQICRLQNYLGKYISDISVLEYDKDIDISKIVRNTHIVVSDSNEDIFIINYKVNGDIVTEDTEDVVSAMTAMLNKK